MNQPLKRTGSKVVLKLKVQLTQLDRWRQNTCQGTVVENKNPDEDKVSQYRVSNRLVCVSYDTSSIPRRKKQRNIGLRLSCSSNKKKSCFPQRKRKLFCLSCNLQLSWRNYNRPTKGPLAEFCKTLHVRYCGSSKENNFPKSSKAHEMKPARMREDIGCGLPLIHIGVLRSASPFFFWVYIYWCFYLIYSYHVLREITSRVVPAKWNE